MEPVRVRCTACGRDLETDADRVGRKVRCPFCRTAVDVPPTAAGDADPPGLHPRRPPSTRHGRRRASRLPWIAAAVLVLAAGVLAAHLLGFGKTPPRPAPAPGPAPVPEAPREGPLERYDVPPDLADYSLEADLPEALVRSNGKKVTRQRLDELKALEGRVRAEMEEELARRRDDPFYDAVRQARNALLSRKGWKVFQFRTLRRDPYLVFHHVSDLLTEKETPAAEADRILEGKIRMLRHCHAFMVERWLDPFGLAMDPGQPLVVVSLRDRKAFDDLHREMGRGVPSGAIAYFSCTDFGIYLYDAVEGKEKVTVEERASNDGTVFHEACHQIVNAYVNRGQTYNSLGRIELPFWVEEGLAEYVGSVAYTDEKDPDGYPVYAVGVPNPERLEQFWEATHPPADWKTPPFHLDLWDLVECFDQYDALNLVKRKVGDALQAHKSPNPRWDRVAGRSVGLVYAEGSAFFQFCYAFEGGKYAAAATAYLESAFQGRHASRFLLEAFGVADLKALNREWLAYVESVTPERVKNPPKKDGKKGK